jgi:hypothetical protein
MKKEKEKKKKKNHKTNGMLKNTKKEPATKTKLISTEILNIIEPTADILKLKKI